METHRRDFESLDVLYALEQRMMFEQVTCNFISLVGELKDGSCFDAVLCDLFIERERIIRWWKEKISELEDIGVLGEDSTSLRKELKREEEVIDDLFIHLLELRNLKIKKEIKSFR